MEPNTIMISFQLPLIAIEDMTILAITKIYELSIRH